MSKTFVRAAFTLNYVSIPEGQDVVGEVTVCPTCYALVLSFRSREHQDWHDTLSQ